MSWLKQVFGLQLSQKTKVYYDKSKEEGDKKEEEHQISDLKLTKVIMKTVKKVTIVGLVHGAA